MKRSFQLSSILAAYDIFFFTSEAITAPWRCKVLINQISGILSTQGRRELRCGFGSGQTGAGGIDF